MPGLYRRDSSKREIGGRIFGGNNGARSPKSAFVEIMTSRARAERRQLERTLQGDPEADDYLALEHRSAYSQEQPSRRPLRAS